ncbi:methyltransferase domain-containing protein [Deinococcus pimensis]|uniref:methyltransferase domain-containing protein n=1 Tax=Deinococcus pimensis TaxID=309888 RepID=UPI0004BCAABE|nr:methyltransferase domain-containing protein [Deinococcus pimensis]
MVKSAALSPTYAGHASFDYLHDAQNVLEHVKRRSFAALALRGGERVADVGAGTGVDAVALARLVGPTGRVYAVDNDAEFTAAYVTTGVLDAGVYPLHADAQDLPFEDEALDAVRAERLLLHVSNALSAVRQFHRVLKPGGRVVLLESDFASLSVNTSLPHVERVLRSVAVTDALRNGMAGRRLTEYLQDASFRDVSVESFAFSTRDERLARRLLVFDALERSARDAGRLTHAEVFAWREDLRARHDGGRFFASITMHMVTARR